MSGLANTSNYPPTASEMVAASAQPISVPLISSAAFPAVAETTDRVDLSQQCIVVAPTDLALLRLETGVFDFDETQVIGSGDHLHDGERARFAVALTQLLWGQAGFDQNDISNAFTSGSCFTREEWAPYRACGGRAEIEVCSAMVELAFQQFHVRIEAEALMQRAQAVVLQNWDRFVEGISLPDGLKDLLNNLKIAGARLGTCSASSEPVVDCAQTHFELQAYFDHRVTSAAKKLPCGSFSGEPVRHTLELLSAAPSSAVMFGDSLADAASAIMAGVKLVVLRPHGEDREAACAKLAGEVQAWMQGDGRSYFNAEVKPRVLIVREFDQVRVAHDVLGLDSQPGSPAAYEMLNVGVVQ